MMYEGTGAAISHFNVDATDKETALDYIMDMLKEDFPDADAYEVANIKEVN